MTEKDGEKAYGPVGFEIGHADEGPSPLHQKVHFQVNQDRLTISDRIVRISGAYDREGLTMLIERLQVLLSLLDE